MTLFPAFLKLAGRRCLVVGGGRIAEEKIEGLLRAGADIRVVAPQASPRIRAWARAQKLRLCARRFRAADLGGVFLCVAAASSPALHAEIFKQARQHAVLCNVVDDPEHCDFYYGAVVRRGALQIAISTGGHSPALAQRLKKLLEREFGAEYESWLEEIGEIRKKLFAGKISPARRRILLHHLASESSFAKFRRRRKRKAK
jgi:precorrin-2 dehydrogenase / sirohydrochlorin ferrochelatase